MPKRIRIKDNERKKDKKKEGMKENDNYTIIIKKKGKVKEDTKKHEIGEGKKKEYAEHKFGGHIDGKIKKPKKIIKK